MLRLKNKFNKVFYLFVLIVFLGFMFPLTVLAQGITGSINKFYNTALGLGGMAAVAVIVIGAIYYTTSGAIDKKNLGKEMITSAIWGLVLLLGAFIVLNTINPELVNLSAPKGSDEFELDIGSVQSFYCVDYPSLPECDSGETTELDEEGNPSCCVPIGGSACPQVEINSCKPKVEDTDFDIKIKKEWETGWLAEHEIQIIPKGSKTIHVENGTKYQKLYYVVDSNEKRTGEYQCLTWAGKNTDGDWIDMQGGVDLPENVRLCDY
jgi:hypothetical protein